MASMVLKIRNKNDVWSGYHKVKGANIDVRKHGLEKLMKYLTRGLQDDDD